MVLEKSGQHLIANAYQIRFRIKAEGIEMEEELDKDAERKSGVEGWGVVERVGAGGRGQASE